MTPVFSLCDEFVTRGAALDPVAAGMQGLTSAFGAATDYGPDGLAARAELLTATLADFLPPTCREIPPIEILHWETSSPETVTGSKGLGEGGAIGAPAAILNAINDALVPFGVAVNEIPAAPQRIRAALRGAERRP